MGKTIDSGIDTMQLQSAKIVSTEGKSRRSCMTHRKVRGVKIYGVPISLKLAGQKARDYIFLFITEIVELEASILVKMGIQCKARQMKFCMFLKEKLLCCSIYISVITSAVKYR